VCWIGLPIEFHAAVLLSSRPVLFYFFIVMEELIELSGEKKHSGWRILGYVLVVLTVLFTLGAIQNLAGGFNSSDSAENLGKIIGAILLPVLVGLSARYCFRKSRR
jgi:predicted Na+-dependent transporter